MTGNKTCWNSLTEKTIPARIVYIELLYIVRMSMTGISIMV